MLTGQNAPGSKAMNRYDEDPCVENAGMNQPVVPSATNESSPHEYEDGEPITEKRKAVAFKIKPPNNKKYSNENFRIANPFKKNSYSAVGGIHVENWLAKMVTGIDRVALPKNDTIIKEYVNKRNEYIYHEILMFASASHDIRTLPKHGIIPVYESPEQALLHDWDTILPQWKGWKDTTITCFKVMTRGKQLSKYITGSNKEAALPVAEIRVSPDMRLTKLKAKKREGEPLYNSEHYHGGYFLNKNGKPMLLRGGLVVPESKVLKIVKAKEVSKLRMTPTPVPKTRSAAATRSPEAAPVGNGPPMLPPRSAVPDPNDPALSFEEFYETVVKKNKSWLAGLDGIGDAGCDQEFREFYAQLNNIRL